MDGPFAPATTTEEAYGSREAIKISRTPAAATASCALLALPRELRDIIYDYVFIGTHHDTTHRYPGIFAVSKQIHAEAVTPFYRLTTFEITAWESTAPGSFMPAMCSIFAPSIDEIASSDIHSAFTWLRKAGAKRVALVKTVLIRVPTPQKPREGITRDAGRKECQLLRRLTVLYLHEHGIELKGDNVHFEHSIQER